MKTYLKKIYWLINQFGLNPISLINSLRGIPRYILDYFKFKKLYDGDINLVPCLKDWYEEGGTTKTEYFWQDLYVAQLVQGNKPNRHVDIGSRIDGFVAHVASFREIEVFDIRNITSAIPNIRFRQADMMGKDINYQNYCDSLSCLHAIEHFGLGRYGDPLHVNGYQLGLRNMCAMLDKNGIFYLATPIGRERVEFNANWIFDPILLSEFVITLGFTLTDFAWFDEDKTIHKAFNLEEKISELAKQRYTLGIFTFKKI